MKLLALLLLGWAGAAMAEAPKATITNRHDEHKEADTSGLTTAPTEGKQRDQQQSTDAQAVATEAAAEDAVSAPLGGSFAELASTPDREAKLVAPRFNSLRATAGATAAQLGAMAGAVVFPAADEYLIQLCDCGSPIGHMWLDVVDSNGNRIAQGLRSEGMEDEVWGMGLMSGDVCLSSSATFEQSRLSTAVLTFPLSGAETAQLKG